MSAPEPEAGLAGRGVIVTGASSGIGAAVSRELAGRGARIVAIARREEPLRELVASLPGEGHTATPMDVAENSDWEEMLGSIGEAPGGLVCAAGVLAPIGPTAAVDPDAVLETVRINLHGTFLAIHHLLPLLGAAPGGAIVTFSGGGATGPLPRFDAYAISKAAVVRLTENVAADEPRVRANAVAPGFVATPIHGATLAAGELAGPGYLERTRSDLASGGVPAERAAALVAMLLGPDAEGITGRLISAPWDPWEDPAFRERLRREPDLCTLRRIDDFKFTTKRPEG